VHQLVNKNLISLFFILSPCMLLSHILKNQLMLFYYNYTILKTQSSKTLECLCPVSPYMFRSLKADHPQWRMFLLHCYLFALLLFLGITLSGHVALSLFMLLCVLSRCSSSCLDNRTSSGRACGFVSVYAVVCALPLLVQLSG
jgi:hypothetical protein